MNRLSECREVLFSLSYLTVFYARLVQPRIANITSHVCSDSKPTGRGEESELDSPPTPPYTNIRTEWVGGWGWGLALTFWAIDDARAVGDDEYKTSNDEG